MKKILLNLAFASLASLAVMAESAGAGSYLTTFPGTDKAGRNSYPPGTPAVSGDAATRPVPTNEWWSNELISAHGAGIFNYPMALKPVDAGLAIIRNMEQQAITAENPFLVGVDGLSAASTTVSDYSDWTVTLRWEASDKMMEATIGQGMPMVYFTRSAGAGDVCVTITSGTAKSLASNIVLVTGGYNGANYALYAPSTAEWTVAGSVIRSSLAGKDYWTVAMLPDGADAETTARDWAASAFVFPADTRADWNYDSATGLVKTTYTVTPNIKEGAGDAVPVIGLLPHHWANLSPQSKLAPGDNGTFNTVRGELKLVAAKEFSTERTFRGILPVLPAAQLAASGYDIERLKALVDEVCDNPGFDDWTDSYNDGQLLNRLSQTALVAREAGYDAGAERAVGLLKKQVERWFTAGADDVAFVFYYHAPWHTLLAYPAGHGQDSNINDHNFHFGYFIEAASTIASFDPAWAEKWGPMVDLLVRDVASLDRDDEMFPYLRSFSPYSGHCWANGFATLGPGNDQESTSEAMMCHSAMIKWAEATGNPALRDAAVWMFATELSAIQEYWFDTAGRNRPAGYKSALASRVFANGYDDENFWGGGLAGSYGIQIYPVQPSSTYLFDDAAYASKLWDAMCSATGILSGDTNPNIWYDAWSQYLALIDPARALTFYNGKTSLMGVKFGATHALTYYWVHSLAAVGTPDFTLTADAPMAQAFRNGDVTTYVASNYGLSARDVRFSDGTKLTVAPRTTKFYSDGELTPAEPGTPVEPGTPEDPDQPVTPSGSECLETGTESSEGEFKAPYTIGFTTINNGSAVRVTAEFEGEGDYVGFAGPWLFNETDGFAEVPMAKDGSRYSATLSGLSAGAEVKVRVKIAFAGGLAVTRQYSYVVGTSCSTTGISAAVEELPAQVSVNGDLLTVLSPATGYATLFSADGRAVLSGAVEAGYPAVMSLGSLARGVYLLRIEPLSEAFAPLTVKILRN